MVAAACWKKKLQEDVLLSFVFFWEGQEKQKKNQFSLLPLLLRFFWGGGGLEGRRNSWSSTISFFAWKYSAWMLLSFIFFPVNNVATLLCILDLVSIKSMVSLLLFLDRFTDDTPASVFNWFILDLFGALKLWRYMCRIWWCICRIWGAYAAAYEVRTRYTPLEKNIISPQNDV